MTAKIVGSAGPLLANYDVVLCDIWGVLHDGRRAYAEANAVLSRYRAGGGVVILVSNAPMPEAEVARVLDEKGCDRDAYDGIVSSGDIALGHIAQRGYRRIHRIGPGRRDWGFFERLPGPDARIEDADAIACTGLVDDRRETAEDYRPRLVAALAGKLPFVCANPDLAVHVGADLLPCAGAIAAIYESMGGPVYWAGKPHPTAYAAAIARAEARLARAVDRSRVLAIGDAVRTDLEAARRAGFDALFIAGGLHNAEVVEGGRIVPERLAALLAPPAAGAIGAMVHLA